MGTELQPNGPSLLQLGEDNICELVKGVRPGRFVHGARSVVPIYLVKLHSATNEASSKDGEIKLGKQLQFRCKSQSRPLFCFIGININQK